MFCCDIIGADIMLAPIGIIMGAAIIPIIPIGAIMVMGPIMLIGFIIDDMPNWACALPLPISRAASAIFLICMGVGVPVMAG